MRLRASRPPHARTRTAPMFNVRHARTDIAWRLRPVPPRAEQTGSVVCGFSVCARISSPALILFEVP